MAKGFHQDKGFDYTKTFSPVVKPVTVRIVLTLVISHKWVIQQLDVNNVFLNGQVNEEFYMVQPPEFEKGESGLVCKLHKALYGLKQSPMAWFDRIKYALLQLGFSTSICGPSLFMLLTPTCSTLALVYVEDIIITRSSTPFIQ